MPDPDSTAGSLNRISTNWDQVAAAHRAAGDSATAARHAFLLRYAEAVNRYLIELVGDPAVADDLTQEFAVRWLTGRFQNADPGRGRFRDYLSMALRNLVRDDFRRRQAAPMPMKSGSANHPTVEPGEDRLTATFLAQWRQGLLDAAWRALERTEDARYYAVLRWRATAPHESADDFAARLTADGKPTTPAGVRQTLHRARKRFAALLTAEVASSLGDGATADEVESELGELGLLDFCRPSPRA